MDITSAAEVIKVRADQLPVCCPGPYTSNALQGGMPLWAMHPRVYIDLGQDGRGKCPYCGTVYELEGAAPVGH